MRCIAVACLFIVACASGRATTNSEPAAPPPRRQEPEWCIRTLADQDGQLMFATLDLGYRHFTQKSDFPYMVHVNITTVGQNRNGHPTDEEAEILNAVEDDVTDAIRADQPIQFVGRLTPRGYREMLYFVADADKAQAALSRLAATKQRREWEYRVMNDPTWSHVQPLLDDDSPCL